MDALFACFLLVGIAVFAYVGYVAVTGRRLIQKIADIIIPFALLKPRVDSIIDRADKVTKSAEEWAEIPPAGHLMDAGINFFAHIGATNLGKDGLNLTKEQASRVTMARNGFNVAGKRMATGAGVPEIMNALGPLMGGGGQGGGGEGGGMDLAGLAKAWIQSKIQGAMGDITGAAQSPPAGSGGGGLPPI